ncbi:MAG: hypothetical protein M3R02_10455 [Chloroflexota bacterium]|nr:hypothetical protein [Chloroflexota bacterium]
MHPSHLNKHGEYEPPTLQLGGRTLVFDRARSAQVMWIQGVVVLPVGAEVELVEPNVTARVINVRLLAGYSDIPTALCLDVDVPAEYWGEV